MNGRFIILLSSYCAIICAVTACQSFTGESDSHFASEYDEQGNSGSTINGGTPTAGEISPWVYNGVPGITIRTSHYRIHTTVTDANLITNLPRFYESAYLVYRKRAMMRDNYRKRSNSNTVPSGMMDVYVLNTRKEWEAFTHELLMERADSLIRLNRGGFTTRGTSVYYDIGYRDTLAIAAHEGWHQFVQTHFVNALPVWLDEGLACTMESLSYGFIIDKQLHADNNPPRQAQLIEAYNNGRLPGIGDFLDGAPVHYVNEDRVLSFTDYYAQAWGLVRFLDEYKHGRYRKGLRRLLHDARSGELSERMGDGDDLFSGNKIFRVYFNEDIDRVNEAFLEYVDDME